MKKYLVGTLIVLNSLAASAGDKITVQISECKGDDGSASETGRGLITFDRLGGEMSGTVKTNEASSIARFLVEVRSTQAEKPTRELFRIKVTDQITGETKDAAVMAPTLDNVRIAVDSQDMSDSFGACAEKLTARKTEGFGVSLLLK